MRESEASAKADEMRRLQDEAQEKMLLEAESKQIESNAALQGKLPEFCLSVKYNVKCNK